MFFSVLGSICSKRNDHAIAIIAFIVTSLRTPINDPFIRDQDDAGHYDGWLSIRLSRFIEQYQTITAMVHTRLKKKWLSRLEMSRFFRRKVHLMEKMMKKCSNQSRVARTWRTIHLLEGDIDFEVQHALWSCEIGSKRENSGEIERNFGQLSDSRTSNQTRRSLEAQLLEPQLFNRSYPTIAESIRIHIATYTLLCRICPKRHGKYPKYNAILRRNFSILRQETVISWSCTIHSSLCSKIKSIYIVFIN